MLIQVKGVKGASILCLHQPFDLALGCTVENLHTIYLGVALLLCKLWFGKENKQKDYSLYKHYVPSKRMCRLFDIDQ